MELTYGGLFEGIGGFALAASWAGMRPVWSNEIDKPCCDVLRKNFTHNIIQSDIRNIGHGREYELQPVDVICGGFPCQPFSHAGQRKGRNDNRYLWPEMCRVISEVRPTWVIGENVDGIFSMEEPGAYSYLESEEIAKEKATPILTKIEEDFKEIGYRVLFLNIPACAVQAPHERKRYWIVGYSEHARFNAPQNRKSSYQRSDTDQKRQDEVCQSERSNSLWGVTSNTKSLYVQGCENGSREKQSRRDNQLNGIAANSRLSGLSWSQLLRSSDKGRREEQSFGSATECNSDLWQQNWNEVAARFCRVDDGLPLELDSDEKKTIYNAVGYFGREEVERKTGIDLQKVELQIQRTQRLKQLGNAIVPQVAYQIFKAINLVHYS